MSIAGIGQSALGEFIESRFGGRADAEGAYAIGGAEHDTPGGICGAVHFIPFKSGHYGVLSFDPRTGKVRWQKHINETIAFTGEVAITGEANPTLFFSRTTNNKVMRYYPFVDGAITAPYAISYDSFTSPSEGLQAINAVYAGSEASVSEGDDIYASFQIQTTGVGSPITMGLSKVGAWAKAGRFFTLHGGFACSHLALSADALYGIHANAPRGCGLMKVTKAGAPVWDKDITLDPAFMAPLGLAYTADAVFALVQANSGFVQANFPVLTKISPSGALTWAKTVPANSSTKIIGHDGRIYMSQFVNTAEGGQDLTVFILDAETGEKIGQFEPRFPGRDAFYQHNVRNINVGGGNLNMLASVSPGPHGQTDNLLVIEPLPLRNLDKGTAYSSVDVTGSVTLPDNAFFELTDIAISSATAESLVIADLDYAVTRIEMT